MIGRGSWKLVCFGVAAAFLFACNLLNVLAPYRAPPEPVEMSTGWIGIEPDSNRGFFRQVIDVPFEPRYAWLAVATDDYTLCVNGIQAAQNQFSINAALPFQHGMSDPMQGVNGTVVVMARAPDLRLAPNREWRSVTYANLTRQIRAGRNVLALALQTAGPSVRLSVTGEIIGDNGAKLRIDGSAGAWHVSRTPDRINGQGWTLATARAEGWSPARFLQPLAEPLQAPAPTAIWTRPPPRIGLSGPEVDGDVRFARVFPALPPDPAQSAWLRIDSTWPYTLFADEAIVGEGGQSGRTEAYDISRFLRNGPRRISLRLHRSGLKPFGMPLVAIDGAVGAVPIGADPSWIVLQQEEPDWLSGAGQWREADQTPMPPGALRVAFQNAPAKGWWLAQVMFCWAACLTAGTFLFAALARLGGPAQDRSDGRAAAVWVLSVPTLAAAAAYLLRLRYKETDLVLDFLDPTLYGRSLALEASMLVLALLAFVGIARGGPGARAMRPALAPFTVEHMAGEWPFRLALLGIAALAFWLRVHNIGFENLQADENVSLDAARGVLRTGAPTEVSGVLYTRSSLYHYTLAGWIWAFGSTPAAARMMSVVPGVAVIFVTYQLALVATGRRYLAIACALMVAVSPWQINQSRNIRFYQEMQFFGVAATYCFMRGFVVGRSKRAQNLFFVTGSLAVLCQEIFVLTFPGFCIAGYLYLRPFRWRDNVNVLIGFTTIMLVTVVDAGSFTLLCLTRNVGITTSVASIIQPHVINPTSFVNTFFLGELHSRFIASLVLLGALPFWIRRGDRVILSLYILIFTTVIAATVLVMQVAARYLFVLNALTYVVLLTSLDATVRWAAYRLSRPLIYNARRYQRAWTALAAPLVIGLVIADIDFGALFRSYDQRLTMQHEDAFHYIAEHKRPGDRVISVSPMAGAIVLGGIDYYLQQQVQFDEVYMTPPAIIDRWAGGTLVTKIDMLRDILNRPGRAWIIMDQPEAKKFTPDFLLYVAGMTQSRFEFLGGDLLLWDPGDALFAHSKNNGGVIDDY